MFFVSKLIIDDGKGEFSVIVGGRAEARIENGRLALIFDFAQTPEGRKRIGQS